MEKTADRCTSITRVRSPTQPQVIPSPSCPLTPSKSKSSFALCCPLARTPAGDCAATSVQLQTPHHNTRYAKIWRRRCSLRLDGVFGLDSPVDHAECRDARGHWGKAGLQCLLQRSAVGILCLGGWKGRCPTLLKVERDRLCQNVIVDHQDPCPASVSRCLCNPSSELAPWWLQKRAEHGLARGIAERLCQPSCCLFPVLCPLQPRASLFSCLDHDIHYS